MAHPVALVHVRDLLDHRVGAARHQAAARLQRIESPLPRRRATRVQPVLADTGRRHEVARERRRRGKPGDVVEMRVAPAVEVPQESLAVFLGLRIGLRGIGHAQVCESVRGGLGMAELPAAPPVGFEERFGPFEGREEDGEGILPIRGKQCVLLSRAGPPDRRVRLLIGTRPRVHVAVVPVLPLPTEGLVRDPGPDDQIVGLAHPLASVCGIDVAGVHLGRDATHHPDDDPAPRHAVDHRELLRRAHRVVPNGQGNTDEGDSGPLCAPGENRRRQRTRGVEAGHALVVLAQRQVQPQLCRVLELLQVLVVERGDDHRVAVRIGDDDAR